MVRVSPEVVRELDAAGAGYAIVVRGDRVGVEPAGHECLAFVGGDEPEDRWTLDGAGYILLAAPELAEEADESWDPGEDDDDGDWVLTDEAVMGIAARLSSVEVPARSVRRGSSVVAEMLGVGEPVGDCCVYCGCDLGGDGLCWQCDP